MPVVFAGNRRKVNPLEEQSNAVVEGLLKANKNRQLADAAQGTSEPPARLPSSYAFASPKFGEYT